ncbi:MAG: biotin/lipoyl-binding protein [Acidobacteriales bacterium]|nr:MAG: biotin/lipoyl-binding protein [Terriglobales bacterium]
MKKKWKIWLAILTVLVLAGGVFYGIKKSRADIVTVQTGRVVRQDLSSLVTASGEVKPRNYVNIGANVMGRLTEILVKEGDHVKKGQLLARLESVQADADVQGQQAALSSAEAEVASAQAAIKSADDSLRTAQATLDRTRSDLEKARLDFERYEQLLNEKLVAKQDYDQRKASYDSAAASVREAQSRLAQAGSQRAQSVSALTGSEKRVAQVRAVVRRVTDVLDKHTAVSPLDGVVTNLPVRVGETVVPGIQNSSASLIMTIADMSLITAEVKVDETDIVYMSLNQPASITIDAVPNKTFKGSVIEIGNTAILRSTGLAASQSAISSQEAKDFKVVIALSDAAAEIRPGLSCTAKITTATRDKALTIPIQALTIRQKGDLEPAPKKGVKAATKLDPAREKARKEELQGVFVVSAGKAEFRKVETGITGATDIEVLGGLKDGEEIITGSYRVIRTVRVGARIKVDNQAPKKSE